MDTDVISRALHFDYLLLVPLVAVGFNAMLIAAKRWHELIVFNVAGLVNVGLELVLIAIGVRHFGTDNVGLQAISIVCLAWVTNGFLFAIADINVRFLLGREPSRGFVLAADAVFLLGLTLASIDYGLLSGSVLVWREMGVATRYVEPIAALVLAAVIFGLGYRKLLIRLLIVGCLIDLAFEARLFGVGVRPLEQLDWLRVGERVFFEMNIALMIGFLLVKAVFGLRDYRDVALGRE